MQPYLRITILLFIYFAVSFGAKAFLIWLIPKAQRLASEPRHIEEGLSSAGYLQFESVPKQVKETSSKSVSVILALFISAVSILFATAVIILGGYLYYKGYEQRIFFGPGGIPIGLFVEAPVCGLLSGIAIYRELRAR